MHLSREKSAEIPADGLEHRSSIGEGQATGRPRLLSLCLSWFLFLAVVLTGARATAQTIAYRQTNLASNLPAVANNLTPELGNPWGIAFLLDKPFFIANNQAGRVASFDATGLSVSPGA